MWLRHHPHGSVLVHGVHASGCDGPAAGRPLPYDGHHEGWRGTNLIYTSAPHFVTHYMFILKGKCLRKGTQETCEKLLSSLQGDLSSPS